MLLMLKQRSSELLARALVACFVVCAWVSDISAQAVTDRELRDVGRPADRIKVSFTLVRSIGSLNGQHDAFGNIWDADLDSRGRIYVADYGQARVSVFDRTGRFLRTIGRRGSGPGEFQNLMQIAVGPGDTLFAFDVGLRRLSRFAPDGRFLSHEVLGRNSAANDIEFPPNGDVVVVGFTPLSESVVHVFDKRLTPRRSFAAPAAVDVRFFSESLLGGYTDITPAGLLLYSQKSPFELRQYDMGGRLLWRCSGLTGVTTPPNEVVTVTGERRELDWKRFVHSTGVFALSDSLFLNVITDPARDRRRLDIIDRSCRLRSTTVLNVPFSFLASRIVDGRRLFVGVRSITFPEAVVYSISLR